MEKEEERRWRLESGGPEGIRAEGEVGDDEYMACVVGEVPY